MTDDHAATGRLQHGRYNSASTKAAPEISSYHPCRCCAQGRFSAPSLPDSPHRATGRARRLRPLPAAAAVVTERCALDRRSDEHHHGADHRLVGAGNLHAGPAGVRGPQDAPAAPDGHPPHHRRATGTICPHRHMRPWAAGSSGSTDAKSPAAASGASVSSPTQPTNDSGPNTAPSRCRSPQASGTLPSRRRAQPHPAVGQQQHRFGATGGNRSPDDAIAASAQLARGGMHGVASPSCQWHRRGSRRMRVRSTAAR